MQRLDVHRNPGRRRLDIPLGHAKDEIGSLVVTVNRLLGRMTDSRMHVKIEAQRQSKKGEPIETLDINISDELGTRNYEMFSGGEAFRIDFAIRIALSRLLAKRAGAPLPTLIIDEGFGTQDSSGIEKLKEAMSRVSVPKMTLEFDHTGSFRRNGGDIWWIGIKENEELRSLQDELYDEIRKAGFSLQSNNFKPHLTLARRVRAHQKPDKSELLGSAFSAEANVVSLMLSEHINGRLVYTELERFPVFN